MVSGSGRRAKRSTERRDTWCRHLQPPHLGDEVRRVTRLVATQRDARAGLFPFIATAASRSAVPVAVGSVALLRRGTSWLAPMSYGTTPG